MNKHGAVFCRLRQGAQKDLPRFITSGGIGFCVDAGVLTLLIASQWSVVSARALSFIAAVTATWAINHAWTFRPRIKNSLSREYLLYLATQIGGALINFSVFLALIWLYPPLKGVPVAPLAAGAVVSMLFNYVILKLLVFRG